MHLKELEIDIPHRTTNATCSKGPSNLLIERSSSFYRLTWQRNSFPLFFIDKCIKRFLDKLFIKRNISGTVSKKKEVLICLEILSKMSLQNKKQLIEIFRTCQKM